MNLFSLRGAVRFRVRDLWRQALAALLILVCIPVLTATAADQKMFPQDSVLRATLENGLRVVIVRNDLAPVATTMINYLAGSNEDPKGSPGQAHALEHMMFRGSPDLTAGQLANIVAELGGKFNAMTQPTVTQYFLTVPAEDLDVALRIEAIRMKGLLSTEDLWREERGAIDQEVVRDLSSPEYLFYTKLLENMFKSTPYANSGLGTTASFARIAGAELKQFHEAWYVPNNAVLVIVGKVDPARTLETIKKYFGSIPCRKTPVRPAVQFKPVQPNTIRLTTGNPYGLYILAFRMPGYSNRDYPASEVLNDILNSTRGDLFNLVIDGKALMTGFELMTYPETGIGLVVAAFPDGRNPAPLIRDVKRILRENIRRGFPSDLVDSAKRKRLTQAELEKNSVQGMAMSWSEAVAVQGRSSPDQTKLEIARVTSSEVNRVARKYLLFDHAIAAVLTPQASGEPVIEKGKGIAEQFVPKQEPQIGLPAWAKEALSRLEIPKSGLEPSVTVLPNGLRLIFQKETASGTVSLYGHVKNNSDMQTPKGKEGVDLVLGGLFSFGTGSLDRIAFQKALDRIGALETAGTDFKLKVLTDHFEQGVSLLAGNLLEPAFPEKAFRTVRAQIAASSAGALRSPDFLAEKALNEALFPKGDPSQRFPTPETVNGITLHDVLTYFRNVFRPDMATIVVIGNIDSERVRKSILTHFGSWQAEGPKPDTRLPGIPANRSRSINIPDRSRIQTQVVLAETLGIDRKSPDYYLLEMGNHILGGSFYATRLYRDLREKTGLVYTVHPSLDAEELRSTYTVEYGCNSENVNKARSIIEYNLKDMQQNPVSMEELDRAKALILREIPLSESSVDRIASGLISRVQFDLPLDEPVLAAKKYRDMTPEEVRAAFAKWFRLDDLVQMTQGPAPK